MNFVITDSVDCSVALKNLRGQFEQFCRLPIKSILCQLFAKEVVTFDEKKSIDLRENNKGDGMTALVELVLRSLEQGVPDKYVGFRETLEESDDKLLRKMVLKLSKKTYLMKYAITFVLYNIVQG